MKRSLATAAACLALVVPLAACDDSNAPDGAQYVIGEGDQYVAFGDSYTAAPGTGAVTKAGGCKQSAVNYPHRIAEETGVELRDNSCSGADTSDVAEPQETPKGLLINDPQVEGLDDDTDLVTFRLGANDFQLIFRIFFCANAQANGNLGTGAQPCTDLDQRSPKGAADQVMDDVATNVESALGTIRDRAPDARIFVIGYPQILPPEGSCDLFPLPEGDEEWARGIVDGLNEALESGADTVDATYIDMFDVSAGHDTCAEEPWMAGREMQTGAVAFHPYAAESQAVAQLVLAELEE